ncbi:hypothetical protein JOQ06_013942 [Pogonophryne albipinna]|uniref:AP complex mu/sigma subunit domain-containing protein n=1 Tax=Pogonophryne albipinna TaxID=1090488 RepID=A0AAD6F4E1_9TELE|nr:hypothetical protein JOQ06_013942 [Pogonophryne albipinna]
MQFMLLFSRQGKLRLQKWYVPLCEKEKKKITRELVQTVLARKPKMCSFLEWRDLKIVYKRGIIRIKSQPSKAGVLQLRITAAPYANTWSCWTNTSAVFVSWTLFLTSRRLTSSWTSSCWAGKLRRHPRRTS